MTQQKKPAQKAKKTSTPPKAIKKKTPKKTKQTKAKTVQSKTNKKAAQNNQANKAAVNAIQDNMKLFLNKPNNQTMEKMMTKGSTQFEKMTQDFSSFNTDGMEAFVQSGSIFAKGMEEIVKTSMAMAQSLAEKQAQFAKEAMSVKTLNEWAEVQNKIAQANFDDFMSSATKLSDLSVKVLTDTTEPLNKQMTDAVQKATYNVAA